MKLTSFTFGDTSMRRLLALAACLALSCSLIGCGESNEVKREINIQTPGGTTIKTQLRSKETKTEKSEQNP
jgi:ABC-type uncharacterized transport system auxiliary subunit